MKKLFLVLALCQAIISCHKPKNDPAPVPFLNVNQTSLSIYPVPGATADIIVESNIDWQVQVSDTTGYNWLQVNKTSGHGNDTIHISVMDEYHVTLPRKGIVTVYAADTNINLKAQQVTIEQKPYNIQLLSKKLLGGSGQEHIAALVPASDGGQLVVALTSSNKSGDVGANHGNGDIWLVKLNSNADTLWTRVMGGSSFETVGGAIATNDGGFVIAASTASNNNGDIPGAIQGPSDIWIIKLKSNGDTEWTRLTGISGSDEAFGIAATPDGGFVVTGTVDVNAGNNDVLVIKFNNNGSIVWQKTYGGSAAEYWPAVTIAGDGSVFVAASTISNNTGDVGANHGARDYWMLKLTPNGDKVWSKVFGGNKDDLPFSIKSTTDGGCIVAGYTSSSQSGDVGVWYSGQSMWVLKLNAGGNIMWNRLFGGTQHEGTYGSAAITNTSDGGYVIAGFSSSSDGDVSTNQGLEDFWVLKLNSAGNKVWSKAYGGSDIDRAYAVSPGADGSFWVAGTTQSNNSGDVGVSHGGYSDGWVIKIKDF